jgi:glucan phosphoethanolaminetransferase (alkaline phosphatase superfamily)
VLLVVPAFVFFMWFTFATYVYLSQNIGGLKALRLSKEYVRGAFWRLWWCFLAFGICAALIFMFVAGLVGVIGTAIGGPVGVALAVVSLFASSSITAYCICYVYRVFQALQQRRGVITDAPKATGPLVAGLIGFCILIVLAVIGARAPKQETETQDSQASAADVVQLVRLKVLKIAVDEYRKDKGSYPATLQNLVPDYVDAGAINLADFSYAPSASGVKVCALAEPQQCLSSS